MRLGKPTFNMPQVHDATVLKAVGLTQGSRRMVLGASVSLTEHEVHRRSFLQSLVQRGLMACS